MAETISEKLTRFRRLNIPKPISIKDANKDRFIEDSLNCSIIEANLDRLKEDTKLRGVLVDIFVIIIICWLLFVAFMLTHNYIYPLSDNVLITLLTTTTIQVLGMMIIILRNLFPKQT